jgi:hypothetical protein
MQSGHSTVPNHVLTTVQFLQSVPALEPGGLVWPEPQGVHTILKPPSLNVPAGQGWQEVQLPSLVLGQGWKPVEQVTPAETACVGFYSYL